MFVFVLPFSLPVALLFEQTQRKAQQVQEQQVSRVLQAATEKEENVVNEQAEAEWQVKRKERQREIERE